MLHLNHLINKTQKQYMQRKPLTTKTLTQLLLCILLYISIPLRTQPTNIKPLTKSTNNEAKKLFFIIKIPKYIIPKIIPPKNKIKIITSNHLMILGTLLLCTNSKLPSKTNSKINSNKNSII